jgi:ADP-heptose:LPS heptosyltransferase
VPSLQIYDRRERAVVGGADVLLSAAMRAVRPWRRRQRPLHPRRVLLLRLERIGDLVMALPALAALRAALPDAELDLVVGSWNADLAGAIPGITRVVGLDAAWLAREGGGSSLRQLLADAREWRRHRYDLAINFEPDIRSNLLLAASGARWTVGYASGGGGAVLDAALTYDPGAHTADNALRLIASAVGAVFPPAASTLLSLPADARARAAQRIGRRSGPVVGMHVSGGRAIKQWPPERFADVARRLAAEFGAAIVLTGSGADRPLTAPLRAALAPEGVVDAVGDADLVSTAALLQQCDVLVTGDTGPMHLASAVGTPVVAVFGPSDPARYGPRGRRDRVVRVDLPCAPCNRIRLPPVRCVGHTPDCLALVGADRVFATVRDVLASAPRRSDVAVTGSPQS